MEEQQNADGELSELKAIYKLMKLSLASVAGLLGVGIWGAFANHFQLQVLSEEWTRTRPYIWAIPQIQRDLTDLKSGVQMIEPRISELWLRRQLEQESKERTPGKP